MNFHEVDAHEGGEGTIFTGVPRVLPLQFKHRSFAWCLWTFHLLHSRGRWFALNQNVRVAVPQVSCRSRGSQVVTVFWRLRRPPRARDFNVQVWFDCKKKKKLRWYHLSPEFLFFEIFLPTYYLRVLEGTEDHGVGWFSVPSECRNHLCPVDRINMVPCPTWCPTSGTVLTSPADTSPSERPVSVELQNSGEAPDPPTPHLTSTSRRSFLSSHRPPCLHPLDRGWKRKSPQKSLRRRRSRSLKNIHCPLRSCSLRESLK